jgi:hypothetical protein
VTLITYSFSARTMRVESPVMKNAARPKSGVGGVLISPQLRWWRRRANAGSDYAAASITCPSDSLTHTRAHSRNTNARRFGGPNADADRCNANGAAYGIADCNADDVTHCNADDIADCNTDASTDADPDAPSDADPNQDADTGRTTV